MSPPPSDPETPTPPNGTPASNAPSGGPQVVSWGTTTGLAAYGDDDGLNWGIFVVAFLIAFSMHAVLGAGASNAPEKKLVERIEMAVYTPPPPPPPPPEPEPEPPKPEPPKPKEPPKELPKLPKDTPPPPPPSNDPPPPEPPTEPVPVVTGINLNSVVKSNSGGPSVRVGNTTYGNPDDEKFVAPSEVKNYAGGKPGFKAAKASSISREAGVGCPSAAQRYPKELMDQGIEGTVTLFLSIDSEGTLVSARIVRSSGNKSLDQLALANIRKCRFSPGQVDGEAVDTNLRHAFRFELYD